MEAERIEEDTCVCLPSTHRPALKSLNKEGSPQVLKHSTHSLSQSTPPAESALESQARTETSPFRSRPGPLTELNIPQNHALLLHKASAGGTVSRFSCSVA